MVTVFHPVFNQKSSVKSSFFINKRLVIYLFGALVLLGSTTACSRKSGCPVNDEAHVKPGKKGKYSNKRGKSNLFPKHMRRD
jgi:hypothetical protein